jgi:hypothetical protein
MSSNPGALALVAGALAPGTEADFAMREPYPRKVVLTAKSSMKSKIRINDYNNIRKYNVRIVVFDTRRSCGAKAGESIA